MYTVKVRRILSVDIVVNANSKEEAIEKARDVMEGYDNDDLHFVDDKVVEVR